MSFDLLLKPSCSGCGSSKDLYGSNCKHLTLCLSCGKTMAENHAKCYECGATITRLIREYNVRACSSNDKNYFIGRFVTGLPSFSKKQSAENKWSIQKEGLQGRQVTDALREKYKNKPWLLEDETGQFQYHGQLEGAQSATYYLLMLQGKEFAAIPAGSWYNFNKVAQYKQLTLEEAEEKMKNRRKTADGYQRWMMKAANNGAAAFGEVEKFDDKESGAGGGRGRRKTSGDEEENNASDRGEEDEEEEEARKSRLGLNKRSGDDDEEGPRGGDLDMDDDDAEKGDDWEHEEIFTDDDEAVAIDPEEREDLAPEIPAPPEIKQDEEDAEDEDNNEDEVKPSKEEIALTSKSSVRCMLTKVAAQSSSKTTSTASCAGPFTEHEIWAVLMRKTPVTTRDLVAKFKSRLKRKRGKCWFFHVLLGPSSLLTYIFLPGITHVKLCYDAFNLF
ncbi:transcription initiation factor IIF subunit alpha isoform X3 [Rhododendron vialii]|uniref:transcription initiation factor IIF subunit alpha isoform X3 n=1 Tax=Rhododendron vialii TaxID=182163 RepID=UPI00265E4EB0|nr:transcription initiation factor IIF subunit alpha isoform X3 [Rhododendron vialii]